MARSRRRGRRRNPLGIADVMASAGEAVAAATAPTHAPIDPIFGASSGPMGPMYGPPTRESALESAVGRYSRAGVGSPEWEDARLEIDFLGRPVRKGRKSSKPRSSGGSGRRSTAHLFTHLDLGRRPVGKKASKEVKKRLLEVFQGNMKGNKLVLNPVGTSDVAGIVKVGASAAGGAIVAQAIPRLVAQVTGVRVDSGVLGLVAQVVSAGVASILGARFVDQRTGAAMLVGGLGSIGVGVVRAAAARVMPVATPAAPKQGTADFLQLSGPVPAQLFANTPPLRHGVGDYIEFKNREDGQIAEAFSMAPSGWQPTQAETF